MKSVLILGLLFVQAAAFADLLKTNTRPPEEIINLLNSSAEQHQLIWIDNRVLSSNTVIMAGWILGGQELTAVCEIQKGSSEICKVSSKVPLVDQDGKLIELRQKTVKFKIEDGAIVGDITMLE